MSGEYNIFAVLDWMAEVGFAGIQININGPAGKFLGGEPSNASHVRKVANALQKMGFFVEVGGRGTDLQDLEWQLQLCAELGADVLRTLLVFQTSLEHTFLQTKRNLEEVLPLAERLGVSLALENHEDVTAEELAAFLSGMEHPFLGACLDTGNDLVLGGDPLAAVRLLAGRACTTHIKDQRIVDCDGELFSVGVPLGEGEVNLPACLDVMLRECPLRRYLIQDTWGYASRMNPFGRPDIPIPQFSPPPPSRSSREDWWKAGLPVGLDGLGQEELCTLARRQRIHLCQDLAYVATHLTGSSHQL